MPLAGTDTMAQKKRPEPEHDSRSGSFWRKAGRFLLLEHILAETAGGANPVLRNVLPGCTGSNAVVRIADSGIVYIAAGANIFLHISYPPFLDTGILPVHISCSGFAFRVYLS